MKVESIVVLNDFCHAQGGASRVAIDEAIALRALGARVDFLGASGPVGEELRDAGVAVVCLDQPELVGAMRDPRAAWSAIWNRRAYRAACALLASHDPARTIVHLHGYTKALSTAPAVAARRGGFAVVCTLHDFFAACPNGAFYDYRRRQPCLLRALSPACLATACDKRHVVHKAYRVLRGTVQRHVAGFPSCVKHYIALSSHSAVLMRPYLPLDARIYPLPNIIDVPRAAPVDPAANAALVVVGRLDEEKGVLLAARVAAARGLPIVFVGDGPLRNAVETTGARVTGWLAAAAVRRELDAARCLVFPSLWFETFGLVVAEAAARGVPAIVSDISAPAERVIDGHTGWVFRAGDGDDLTRCLELTRDDATVRAAGDAAYRAYLADPGDPGEHARRLVAIYADVLASEAEAAREAEAVRETTWADSAANAGDRLAASSSRQQMNFAPPASASTRAMAETGPNHPTASQ